MSKFTVQSAKQDLESIEPHYRDGKTDSLLLSTELLDINVGGMVFRVLKSTFAFFPKTRTSKTVCAKMPEHTLKNDACFGKNRKAIKESCEGRRSCSFRVTNRWYGDDPCDGTFKYLEVTYKCERRS